MDLKTDEPNWRHESSDGDSLIMIKYDAAMSRPMCYRCFWPQSLCWCESIRPMDTRTKFVFLMHPKEFKHEKAGTGRLTHLCLANSELHMGIGFDGNPSVQTLINDPAYFPVLLYPGVTARNISEGGVAARALDERRLLIFLLDGTWSCARKMLRLSSSLKRLPRVMFNNGQQSRFVIKQQPQVGCLSTLEATHEALVALERSGLDRYADPDQLLRLFQRMQDFQIRCAADPTRNGYRHQPYKQPHERVVATGRRAAQRSRYFQRS
jgi:DTW domain-containing protein YfiP